MAGHSHASNVKHKKDRNDKSKGQLFLKLRRKIELFYTQDSDYEKVVALAREYNFPKEKVKAIVEKIKQNRLTEHGSFQQLYRGSFNTVWYLEGINSSESNEIREELISSASFKPIGNDFNEYFQRLYLLTIAGSSEIEDFVLSSFSSQLLDKINRIEKKKKENTEFQIIFTEKWAQEEAQKVLAEQIAIATFETEIFLVPFISISLSDTESHSYFLKVMEKLSELSSNWKVSTNVHEEGKWDHSSVG